MLGSGNFETLLTGILRESIFFPTLSHASFAPLYDSKRTSISYSAGLGLFRMR
jgi:hypothetical protein